MLFITPSSNATEAKDYYTRQLAPSDYYTKDMTEMPGQWHGLGSEAARVSKAMSQQKDFFALADNINPQTGKSLTRNTQANRRVLYDFTFDAPKSVSLVYELGRRRADPGRLSNFRERNDGRNGRRDDGAGPRERSGRGSLYFKHGLGRVLPSHDSAR